MLFFIGINMQEIMSESQKTQKIDNNLSSRFIALDPGGYFLIKIDSSRSMIIAEHYNNNINSDGLALHPETGEVLDCETPSSVVLNARYEGCTAKELGVAIIEQDECLVTKLDHALYLGRELQKAEFCMLNNLDYLQD